jgi:hypothetical protein
MTDQRGAEGRPIFYAKPPWTKETMKRDLRIRESTHACVIADSDDPKGWIVTITPLPKDD